MYSFFFFFNDTATTEIYTLSLHDALPISPVHPHQRGRSARHHAQRPGRCRHRSDTPGARPLLDRKSTRLNSSHQIISYAVFCLKKKKQKNEHSTSPTTRMDVPPYSHTPTG